MENKKYAFVSDYFRLKALYEFGGFYFHADVEAYKSFDELFRFKFENVDSYLCRANNLFFTWVAFHFYNDFKLKENYQETKDFSIFHKTEFEISSF